MSYPQFINLPLSNLKPNPEGASLPDTPQMEIYDRIIKAAMQGYSPEFSAALRSLDALPFEQRYVWRVISALGVAFGDFDSACIRLDLDSLPGAQVDRMTEEMETRAVQFCILMREFFGEQWMRNIMAAAIDRAAKRPDRPKGDKGHAA